MAKDVDFQALRRRAANLTAADLITAGTRLGWTLNTKKGKGSHVALEKGGRTITVPMHQNKRTYQEIIGDLERFS